MFWIMGGLLGVGVLFLLIIGFWDWTVSVFSTFSAFSFGVGLLVLALFLGLVQTKTAAQAHAGGLIVKL